MEYIGPVPLPWLALDWTAVKLAVRDYLRGAQAGGFDFGAEDIKHLHGRPPYARPASQAKRAPHSYPTRPAKTTRPAGPVPRQSRLATVRGLTGSNRQALGSALQTMGGKAWRRWSRTPLSWSVAGFFTAVLLAP
jgi:hypothetical protein